MLPFHILKATVLYSVHAGDAFNFLAEKEMKDSVQKKLKN